MKRTGRRMSEQAVERVKDWFDRAASPWSAKNESASIGDQVQKHSRRPKEKRPKPIGIMFQGLEPIEVDPIIDPPQRGCFNCWEPGHKSLKCPKPSTLDEYCENCGRRHVLIFTCPRCARAYKVVNWLQSLEKPLK